MSRRVPRLLMHPYSFAGYHPGQYRGKSGSLRTHVPYQPPDDDDGWIERLVPPKSFCCLACLVVPPCPMSESPCRPCQSVTRFTPAFLNGSHSPPPCTPCTFLRTISLIYLWYLGGLVCCSFSRSGFGVLYAPAQLSHFILALLARSLPLPSFLSLTRSLPHTYPRPMPGRCAWLCRVCTRPFLFPPYIRYNVPLPYPAPSLPFPLLQQQALPPFLSLPTSHFFLSPPCCTLTSRYCKVS
jgi:hypothetical protein